MDVTMILCKEMNLENNPISKTNETQPQKLTNGVEIVQIHIRRPTTHVRSDARLVRIFKVHVNEK